MQQQRQSAGCRQGGEKEERGGELGELDMARTFVLWTFALFSQRIMGSLLLGLVGKVGSLAGRVFSR